MKAKVTIYVFFGCLLMIVFSCKENDTVEETIIMPVPKIKTVTVYENNAIQNINSYEYDNLGRCTKLTVVTVPTDVTRYNTYHYTPDMVLVDRIYDEFNHYTRDTIFLNEHGLQVRTAQGSEVREYDANGYLMQRKVAVPVEVTEVYTFHVFNGNTFKIINAIEGAAGNMIFSTLYLTFLPNSVNTIGIENKGFYFNGKQNKNLVKEYHTDIKYRDPALYRASYLYEYDAKSRVTKRIILGSQVKTYETYTYYD